MRDITGWGRGITANIRGRMARGVGSTGLDTGRSSTTTVRGQAKLAMLLEQRIVATGRVIAIMIRKIVGMGMVSMGRVIIPTDEKVILIKDIALMGRVRMLVVMNIIMDKDMDLMDRILMAWNVITGKGPSMGPARIVMDGNITLDKGIALTGRIRTLTGGSIITAKGIALMGRVRTIPVLAKRATMTVRDTTATSIDVAITTTGTTLASSIGTFDRTITHSPRTTTHRTDVHSANN